MAELVDRQGEVEGPAPARSLPVPAELGHLAAPPAELAAAERERAVEAAAGARWEVRGDGLGRSGVQAELVAGAQGAQEFDPRRG